MTRPTDAQRMAEGSAPGLTLCKHVCVSSATTRQADGPEQSPYSHRMVSIGFKR